MKSEDDSSMVAVATMEEEETEENEGAVEETANNVRSDERRESGGLDRKTSTWLARDSLSSRKFSHCQSQLSPEGLAKANGIDLDLEQSWQRSLMRELHRMNLDGPLSYDPNKPELVLLCHSDSHDNAFEVERDCVSVGTNSSGTVPTKPQLIHRSHLNRNEGHFQPNGTTARKTPPPDHRDESPNGEPSPPQPNRIREGAASHRIKSTKKGGIPEELPHNRGRAKASTAALPLHRARSFRDGDDYLEVELSDEEVNAMPNAACGGGFCWGYNVLDFWLQPNTPQYRRHLTRAALPDIVEDVDTFAVTMDQSKGEVPPLRDDPIGAYVDHKY